VFNRDDQNIRQRYRFRAEIDVKRQAHQSRALRDIHNYPLPSQIIEHLILWNTHTDHVESAGHATPSAVPGFQEGTGTTTFEFLIWRLPQFEQSLSVKATPANRLYRELQPYRKFQ